MKKSIVRVMAVSVLMASTVHAAQQISLAARHADRASACDNAKRQANEAARRTGKSVVSTGACDCSKRELDPQSPDGIAAKSAFGSATQWTCQVDATLN
ncbi:hypothetical protein AB870_26410 [Pandoraea faecigallinarum]|uniref:hypothetical protein n=1 Tax=Pandoraea faecigallinarum TaxID=656179 RepID=UPI000655CFC1|nr:hypothetical protein [Pandoraea faecigallinarum]AOX47828.1 hypothetical protein AB870_26410 [Pandoraea faecigallinarum]